MFLDHLFSSASTMSCPYCGRPLHAPGIDSSQVHPEKASWFFGTSNPTMNCPNCGGSVEFVKNSWF